MNYVESELNIKFCQYIMCFVTLLENDVLKTRFQNDIPTYSEKNPKCQPNMFPHIWVWTCSNFPGPYTNF